MLHTVLLSLLETEKEATDATAALYLRGAGCVGVCACVFDQNLYNEKKKRAS